MARNKVPGLDVWLYGHRVAHLTEPSTYRYKLEFTDEALDVFGQGARVLSLALPFDTKAVADAKGVGGRPVAAFLEGLLPEGNLRRHLAASLGVTSIDKLELLRAVGAECAGAVQFIPEGEVPSTGTIRELSDDEVNRLVADLPTYHLPEGTVPQASLAGIQDKVLLVARPDGSWGWPEGGAVSSHIIKPEPLGGATVPHLIQAEHWAMSVAGAAGLSAAQTTVESFDGRSALVVARYDRTQAGDRLHQEDFCQSLGLDPDAKYESTAESEQLGSRLRRLASVAADRAMDPQAFRVDLLSAVTFNVIMGNGDAHSKNYSLLLGRRGEVSLAPMYDSAPVMYLDPRFKGTGHIINGRTNIDSVDEADLVAEARSWGLAPRIAQGTVRTVMANVWDAVHSIPLPPGTESVSNRLEALWARRQWTVP
ncbi:type II toxin-antitoxin system HipA family toxin [Nocardia altamirensis]|uniref:type II toxin-antitoxin system HipA family toxin n=1 Tax=Nocardia altamirensis TaxID=472158 RepID=UPI00084027DF|nr:HipA domain-containing protein [Nocardia altamirensis]